jgi:heme/copper-type cytochrome/quinol oxidase subunit 1
MFSTVRYFIKTSIVFLSIGILTGLYLIFAKYLPPLHYTQEFITAHVHIILVGAVIMMIMGVALWFFPRPEKTDKRYNPDLILATYLLMTVGTAARFLFQIISGFYSSNIFDIIVVTASTFQVIAILLFFYSIWGRIRSVGSYKREAKGEKF